MRLLDQRPGWLHCFTDFTYLKHKQNDFVISPPYKSRGKSVADPGQQVNIPARAMRSRIRKPYRIRDRFWTLFNYPPPQTSTDGLRTRRRWVDRYPSLMSQTRKPRPLSKNAFCPFRSPTKEISRAIPFRFLFSSFRFAACAFWQNVHVVRLRIPFGLGTAIRRVRAEAETERSANRHETLVGRGEFCERLNGSSTRRGGRVRENLEAAVERKPTGGKNTKKTSVKE